MRQDTQHLLGPWLLYGTIAAAYISLSVWDIATIGYGRAALLPVFCLPGGFCYPALPSSLILFSGFTFYLVRTWGWKTAPMVIMAGASYDSIAGGVTTPLNIPSTWPLLILWGLMISGSYLLVRPKIAPWNPFVVSWLWYELAGFYFVRLFFHSGLNFGIASECIGELLFFLAFIKTVTPALDSHGNRL